MNQEEQGNKMGQLIAKCWADEGFKQKLLADTMATMKAEGTELPVGVTVKAVENTDQVFHLVISAKPKTDLSDADLDKVAGGGDAWVCVNYCELISIIIFSQVEQFSPACYSCIRNVFHLLATRVENGSTH